MTVAGAPAAAPPLRPSAAPAATAIVVLAGVAALLARPLLPRLVDGQLVPLAVLFTVLGLVGVAWPLAGRHGDPSAPLGAPVALALGIAAFAAGRLLGASVHQAAVAPVLLDVLAAVAEEAFFRRLVYGLLEPHGTAIAVAGSALCFALVHVTVWGTGVLPLDLAAGLLLGWQRAATGRWSVPAVTHVAANLLAVL